ncbi:MAG: hypothetical protein IJ875_03310 [Solobacterium sp.]|nr:hypothetical protein [Solobacterium sp.]
MKVREDEVRVNAVVFLERVIMVEWEIGEFKGCTHLYRHTNGTYAPDADSKKLGRKFMEIVLKHVIQAFLDANYPIEIKEKYGHSEWDRVEGLIKKEEYYQKQIRRMNHNKGNFDIAE